MVNTILPASISKAAHLKALDVMAGERLTDINIGVVMVNLIDTAPVAALPFLAQQFNILGYKGWKFADTEQKQRDLLKRAIELHRYKGTPYGIKTALAMAGVVGAVEIRERVTLKHNGEFFYNGIGHYGHHWAYFRVLIDIANLNGLSIEDIKGVVNEYKNVRSWLLDVTYYQKLESGVGVSESLIQGVVNIFSDKVEASDSLNNTVI